MGEEGSAFVPALTCLIRRPLEGAPPFIQHANVTPKHT